MFPSYAYQPIPQYTICEPPSAQNVELAAICRQYPVAIPVAVAAKFLGISKDCLRAAIDQNRCPFGFSWRQGDRAGYKIPTMAFYSWLLKGSSLPSYHNPGGDQQWRPKRKGLNSR